MRKTAVCGLVIAVVLTSGVTALAAAGDLGGAAFSDIAGHVAEADLTALGALGVFEGSQGLGGPVDPSSPITREQYCKVVVVAAGLDDKATLLHNIQPVSFSDHAHISRWAWGYVNAAVSEEIIRGYDDGTFKPQRTVTYAEAIVMLIRSVKGHETRIDTTMPWPLQVVFYGIPAGFTGDVVISDPNGPCTRGDMARMLLATMQVTPLLPEGSPDPAGPALKELDRLWTGSFLSRTGGNMFLDTVSGPIALGDPVYLVGASTYEACVGNQVVCIGGADRKVVFIRLLAGSSLAGVFKTTGSDGGGSFVELQDGRKYYYTGDVPVVLNNDTATANTQNDLITNDELSFNLDGDGRLVAITAKRFDLVRRKLLMPHPMPAQYLQAYDDYISDVSTSTSTIPTKITLNNVSDYHYWDIGTSTWKPLKSAVLDIGSSAVVKVNGVPANRNSLAADDVVRVATFGAKGYSGAVSIIEICASRIPIEGTVVTNTIQVTTEGTRYLVRLNVSGTDHDFERNTRYLPVEPTVGEWLKFSRDSAGCLFHQIAYGDVDYDVFVTGGLSSGTDYAVTFDHRGTEITLASGPHPGAFVNRFCRVSVHEGTGIVTGFTVAPFGSFETATVLAVSATGVTLQIGGATYFSTDDEVVVYHRTGSSEYAFIGCGGLTVGSTVQVFLTASDLHFIYSEP